MFNTINEITVSSRVLDVDVPGEVRAVFDKAVRVNRNAVSLIFLTDEQAMAERVVYVIYANDLVHSAHVRIDDCGIYMPLSVFVECRSILRYQKSAIKCRAVKLYYEGCDSMAKELVFDAIRD